ncbi:hypothetical protein [Geothrix alkalitolerans]|uniref:hypothetical protein n=1 Tax=Geothrix alkalitolerans TaxID=2922724 RepID=UPI001FB04892|nr:hypothetical protein [Geothrix alkalitolerans]
MRPGLPLPLALLLCGALLRADGLSDLKAALKGLPAPAKVTVKVEAESLERESGKDRTERRTTVVEDGSEGTRILEDSRAAATPAKAKGGTRAPGAAKKGSGEFHDELRPAEGLLEQLEKARLLEERAEAYEGRPARRLRLAMDLDLDADARSHLKKADYEATVWIGSDGLPLAMDHHIEVRARVLLLASVWTKVDIRRRFQRAQNRLLVLDEHADVQGAALGKSFSAKETTRCTVL